MSADNCADEIDRALTWETLAGDLASWRAAFAGTFTDAEASLNQSA